MEFELIPKYFPTLSPTQIDQFKALKNLYDEWNSKINLISRKDMEHFYERHVLHSLGIAKIITFKSGQEVLDVGTGGGFPGIPLAILFPETAFYLVDSIGKKIRVVKEVAEALNLKNVEADQIRAEDVSRQFDYVVSRAVTRLKPFITWIKGKVKPNTDNSANGIYYLKGGDLEDELAELKKEKKVYELNAFFEEDFFDTKKVVFVPMGRTS